MTKFLHWMRRHVVSMDAAPRIFLLLHRNPVHSCDEVAQQAEELGIELVLVPRGLTDQLQPLDRCGFAPFKAIQATIGGRSRMRRSAWTARHLLRRSFMKSAAVGL